MARDSFNYQSASDYYRDVGEEEQLKAMRDCGLIDEDEDPENITYYSRVPKFDPYERNMHIDYGFTYEDPDDERITFPNGETFDILDVADDDNFWDEYEKIIQDKHKEELIENIEKSTERSETMSNIDPNMKALMDSSINLFNQKAAELTGASQQLGSLDRSSASGRRTIIANIENEIKAKNPALAYNTIDKIAASGKPRPAGIDMVKLRAERIFNEGYNSLAEYEKAHGITSGVVMEIADPGRAIPVGDNSAVVPGVNGGIQLIPNAAVVDGNVVNTDTPKPVNMASLSNTNQIPVPPIQNQPAGTAKIIPGINAGLGQGVPANIKELIAPDVTTAELQAKVEAKRKQMEAERQAKILADQEAATRAKLEAERIQAAANNIQNSTPIHTIPNVETQPATPGVESITPQTPAYEREAIRDMDNQIELLKKTGYIAESQNKKAFRGVDMNKLVEARKELDTPRLATARMSYRKLERDLAICVLDSGIPEDKIDVLMELFNAIGVGESFALAVEQVAMERSNSNIPLRGRLEAKYSPYDIFGHVSVKSEKTEPILSQEANRIMDVSKPEAFVFASIKKSQVLDLLDYINKNGVFIYFNNEETKVAYSELANSCLYNNFNSRSFENWKSIIYYMVGMLNIQDTLLREYYIQTFGDIPENDKNKPTGGNDMTQNNNLRPAFGVSSTGNIPGMITQPTQPVQTVPVQTQPVQPTPVAPVQPTIPQPGVQTQEVNPMVGTPIIQNPAVNTVNQVQTQPVTPQPVNMPSMSMNTGAGVYGGVQPTIPAQVHQTVTGQVGQVTTQSNVVQPVAPTQPINYTQPTYNQVAVQPAANMQMATGANYIQPVYNQQVATQPMMVAPPVQNQQITTQQYGYTQPIIAQPVQPAMTQPMQSNIYNNGYNNQMGGNQMMMGYNNGYNYNNGMNMMNQMQSTQMGMGMNPMMGNSYNQTMYNRQYPVMAPTQANMMNQGYNQFGVRNPMTPVTPTTPMMGTMGTYNPAMYGQNNMNMMNGYNPMMNHNVNMMGYNQPMIQPMMNQNPMMGYNGMNNMMGYGYNQNPMMTGNNYNGFNILPASNPMTMHQMSQNPMMTQRPMNPMMGGQNMMMGTTSYNNPMMNMNPMASQYNMYGQNQMMGYNNPMMGQPNMMGYGYNGYGMNGMGF